MDETTTARIAKAVEALESDGYSTHETVCGTVYIADIAPDSSEYGGNTEPGSAWDEECDELADAIRAIVAPFGCDVEWSDNDLTIISAD